MDEAAHRQDVERMTEKRKRPDEDADKNRGEARAGDRRRWKRLWDARGRRLKENCREGGCIRNARIAAGGGENGPRR